VNPYFDLESTFLAIYERCRSETMTSIERLYALHKAIEHVIDAGIPGDFVECGVWHGGSVMMMALSAAHFGALDRTIWLYDTFSGMPPPGAVDVQAHTGTGAQALLDANERNETNPFWAVTTRRRVEANMRATGYPTGRIRIVEGDVLRTLPDQAPREIAVLRLDTDWYASTLHELGCLYPRLPCGGVLIIDDYGYWEGARKATDEFLARQPQRPMLHRIDFTGRICTKP
jgi:O-methyltransferase